MIFCTRLAKIIAMSIPVYHEEEFSKYSFDIAAIRTHLRNNPLMVTRLIDTFSGIMFFGKPYGRQKWFISKDGLPLYVSLLKGMEFFALSHEYGHIICNHFGDSYSAKVTAKGGEQIDEISFKSSQELEADNLGLSLCVLNLKKRYRDPAAWTSGIYVFFRLHGIIEDLEPLFKKVFPLHVSTHPSASIRLKAILDYIEMKAPEDLKPRVLHSLRNLDVILDLYKEILVKYFTELRDRGISLTRKPLFLNNSQRPEILGILKEPYHTYVSQWAHEHNTFTEP